MPSGGARANAGKKNKFGESSQMRRVPGSWTADDVTEAVKARETVGQMRKVMKNWRAQGNSADKPDAIHLLQELETLLFAESE